MDTNTVEPIVVETATKKAFQWAFDTQCACNLSGIVYSLQRLIGQIPEQDAEYKVGIIRLFSEQFMSLTRQWEPIAAQPTKYDELPALVNEFADVMDEVCKDRDQGTEQRNTNPKAKECAMKIAMIVGTDGSDWTNYYNLAKSFK